MGNALEEIGIEDTGGNCFVKGAASGKRNTL
jgi:hypothetical protein